MRSPWMQTMTWGDGEESAPEPEGNLTRRELLLSGGAMMGGMVFGGQAQ